MFTVSLYTLGCKVSQYETEAIAEGFARAGFEVRAFDEVCDAYVVNTCTVTAESDRKSRQMIRRAIKKNPNAVIAAVGCYTQRSSAEVAAIPGVDIVIGTDGKMGVIDAVIERLKERDTEPYVSVTDVSVAEFEPMTITRAPRTRAYLKIEDGCESRCTYCAISDARGRVRSKPKDDVIAEVEALSESGIREIVLTGIETGSYGRDFEEKYTLADLICELDKRGSCRQIRLGSLAPELVGEEFCEKVKGTKILVPHFHISMQSGSNKVLRAMKRRYTRERALENIKRLKEAFPRANFTTDLMVGFPGEGEEDFLLTCDFVREAELLDAHVFAYSRRHGTPAADFDGQIDESVKKERSERLIGIKNEMRDEILARAVESKESLSAICESKCADGYYAAHSDNYIEIKFKADTCRDLIGEEVRVIPVSHKDGVLYCEPQEIISK